MKKNLVLTILLAIFVVLVGVFIYMVKSGKISPLAAPSNATLALLPSSGNYVIGNNFNVDIILNTSGQATAGTDALLTYNPLDLQVQDSDAVTAGTQIKPGTLYAIYPSNSVDATTGKIFFSGIITPGGTGYTGTGVLATITFKVLRVASSSTVSFNFTLGATNDSNVAEKTSYSDILGSVTNGIYNLVPPDVTTTINLQLQGRTDDSTPATTSLKIYNTGTSTLVWQKNDIAISSAGTATVTISGVPAGNYDYKIKVTNFLIKAITNTALVSPLTLNFAELKGGDLNNDNLVNSLDFSALSGKWGQSDATADINQDGIVNTIDFAIMNANWLVSGQ